MSAGRAGFPHHVAPPEKHGCQHGQHAEDEDHVIAEMGGQDDAKDRQEAAKRPDDRPRAGIRKMIGMLHARTGWTGASMARSSQNRATLRVAAHAISITTPPGKPPRPGRRIITKSLTSSRGSETIPLGGISSFSTFLLIPPPTLVRHAARPWQAHPTSRHHPRIGRTYRTR